MNSPFVKNFDELLLNITTDIQNGDIGFYMADDSNESIFDHLLVQKLKRKIDNQEISFWSIRDIKLKEELKGKGTFKTFFKALNAMNINLMFHDVINDRFYSFLMNNGYKVYHEVKYDQELTSCYKLMD
jgi:hypothetical protein